jgi:hypothetical protein
MVMGVVDMSVRVRVDTMANPSVRVRVDTMVAGRLLALKAKGWL